MAVSFVPELRPLLEAVAQERVLFVPRQVGTSFSFERFEADRTGSPELNPFRAFPSIKEFLFPYEERVAGLPGTPVARPEVEPFAVFGLKACDLRAVDVLDKVFLERGFEDPFYVARRGGLFTIASDCTAPGPGCLCTIVGGRPYPERGYDLNIVAVTDGFIVESGSPQGRDFMARNAPLFGDAAKGLVKERDRSRAEVQAQVERMNVEWGLGGQTAREIVRRGAEAEVFDEQARTCVECQACTRICPTCHCFYLYDLRRKDYFAKMKMWDSCMRMAYAEVAGGENPRRVLGDRLRHRLMHKFVYFYDRYGVEMCVGCGRCVEAEVGGVDLRKILAAIHQDLQGKGKSCTKAVGR